MSGVVVPKQAVDGIRDGRADAVVLIEPVDGAKNEQGPEPWQRLSTEAVAGSEERGCWSWVPREELSVPIGSNKLEKWSAACIYQVPTRIRDHSRGSYTPQLVSLGPFHHGEDHLLPMEEHKRRVLLHCLRRRGAKPLADFIEAMNGAADELESMYCDLPVEWSGEQNRGRFVETMIIDGYFMLEVIRMATGGLELCDYDANDPIFGVHAHVNTIPYVRRDMLLIENQLPLLALEKIVAVEGSKKLEAVKGGGLAINAMVLKFLSPSTQCPENLEGRLRLHPLDVFRYSRIQIQGGEEPFSTTGLPNVEDTPMLTPTGDISAMALHDAGVQLRMVSSKSVRSVRCAGRVLSLPILSVNELTEPIFLNLIAFERLHVRLTSFPVTGYVFFMSNVVKSVEDVSLLESKSIIRNALGNSQKVVQLFESLNADLHVYPKDSPLLEVHQRMETHCQAAWSMWRAYVARKYFRSPWAPISLAGSTFFLLMTVARNIYGLTQRRMMDEG
ncbi:UPF0481 protein At3g47200-like isoform X2 [Panicum virgatum]|uniref:Uncharacterized protein n=1 Tax=Panicum virgatum TaxID=38727 RepID=A0A8T0QKI3_PANVG|nr:UPF0481 protein At3g47200-like isoform X2 [Panicum virgatum]KAG2573222.1 hypothetical protein PVAP13_7KG247900 [Panicum virgatum]